MTAAITLDGVTKRFGTVTAVDDLNLEFRQDVVTGLLGRNDADKTVTLTGSRERVDALLPGRSVLRSTQVGAMRTVIVENSPGLATQAKAAGLTGGDGSPHPGGRRLALAGNVRPASPRGSNHGHFHDHALAHQPLLGLGPVRRTLQCRLAGGLPDPGNRPGADRNHHAHPQGEHPRQLTGSNG